MSVKKINETNFETEILGGGTALVDFYADWCGPCKMIAPVVEEIAAENPNITVGKVNVDESSELAAKFGVMSIPTLIVFKEGKEYSKIVGFNSKAAILDLLK